MFIQCKWTLIYNLVVGLLLCFYATCAANAGNIIKFAGTVENIAVYALEDEDSLDNDNDNTLKSLKLNVSWMPPDGERQPSSYSIVIISLPKETDVNRIECTEGSALYTIQNTHSYKSQFSLLVPENKLLSGMPEVQIRPNCTYKIQVHANPRARPVRKLPEVIYTVPECVGRKCSCVNAKSALPVPKVQAIQRNRNIVINWNITSNDTYVSYYMISIGVPLLTSKAGHPVYNITKISNVTSATNSFTWDSRINNRYARVKNGYKVLVAAVDQHGCLGTRGEFTIVTIGKPETSNGNIVWLLLVGIVTCVILGSCFILIRNKNEYQHLRLSRPLRRRRATPALSTCKSQWPDLVFQKQNILYLEQSSEETRCKDAHEHGELEIPYECINLMYELGKGQFGRVYLGGLNNNKDTLVAVKMSQCSDASNEPEARRQLLEEIETMKAVGCHPNLVSLIGYCASPDSPICILLEYMEGGDLLAYLRSRRQIESDEIPLRSYEKDVSRYRINIAERDKIKDGDPYGTIEKRRFMKFALDIARGMEHLEAKGITHRDLAARNILVTSGLSLKVSDFGLSRNGVYVINNAVGKVRQLPIRWMSPEAVRDRIFSSKSDVWSFGIVLWEIGTLGSFPYPDIQDDELLHYLIHGKCRLTCPDAISRDVYKIMCSCWSAVPQDRPSFAQLVLDLRILKEPLHSVHETSNPCYTLMST